MGDECMGDDNFLIIELFRFSLVFGFLFTVELQISRIEVGDGCDLVVYF